MSTNPYAAPSAYASSDLPPFRGEDGYVKQIPIVGIFMIVEGALELICGIFLVGVSIVMPTVLMSDPNFQKQMDPNMPVRPESILFWTYLGMGIGPLIAGLLRTISGIYVLQRRGRTFAIVANCIGFISFTGCYCIPTGFGASIYSLIILFQGSVANAFAMREAERRK